MANQSDITEKPQNGIKGLKHWRFDLLAGLQVALVSLPLSLGIAIASGAPPVTGLISAIIAGLIFPLLGGAYVTISGPAAGLAPALLAGMILLGEGDLVAGYPLLLVAICLTGLAQILLALFKTGRFAVFLPVTVVEAMLAAIGIMIIVKQIPALLGDFVPPAKSMLVAITNLPDSFLRIDPAIAIIGGICLFLMFYLNRARQGWLRRVPAPLVVAGVGIGLGYLLQLDPKYLITMPQDILEGGITMPAFDIAWQRTDLWWNLLLVVITLTLIDGIESLATVAAVDKIDPYRRQSDPNVTLRAMGVSNMLSSIFGGLTIIPGGVKSRVNIDAGGRTLWANFYNAVFLIVFLFLAKDLISRIPLAAIGAILVYVGWRLCELQVFRKTFAIGRDQILVFIVTVMAILATDLLIGILIGVAAEIALLVYLLTPSFRAVLTGRFTFAQSLRLLWRNFTDLFRSPVIKVKLVAPGALLSATRVPACTSVAPGILPSATLVPACTSVAPGILPSATLVHPCTSEERAERPHYRISFGSIVCFNLLALDKTLRAIPPDAGVTLAVTESGRIIDHTAMEYLHQFQEACLHEGRPFELLGLDNFYQFTPHALSARMHDAKLVKEKARVSAREQQMAEVAQSYDLQYTPATVAVLNEHDFVYLRRGSNRQKSHVITGTYRGSQVKLFDYSHTTAPDYYAERHHTLLQMSLFERDVVLPNLAVTPGNYLERYLVEYQETNFASRVPHYRLYAQDPVGALHFVGPNFEQLLRDHTDCYVEIRDNVLLVFRPNQEFESPEAIASLLAFADAACRALKPVVVP